MSSITVNPGVTTFVLVRCQRCGKPQFEATYGATLRFRCTDRGCRAEQQQRV